MNERIEDKKERLVRLQGLLACEGFTCEFLPELAARAQKHALACRDRTLTPMQRAEHIEAAHLAEELQGWAEKLAKSLEHTIKEIKEGKK